MYIGTDDAAAGQSDAMCFTRVAVKGTSCSICYTQIRFFFFREEIPSIGSGSSRQQDGYCLVCWSLSQEQSVEVEDQ